MRANIDEYTMRVGQQAVVLIAMPGKTAHNFKVFGAQPLESVIRACKSEIMVELEQALLEQAPVKFKEDSNKHELPPLVIDGIPTPVEKMTQAQLRAFIPLMLKYSTGRGKPGWGKDSTRPPWWPEDLPWANVRSDARDEDEKQRVSWTTTLRQIVTNCYQYHGRDDLLPSFDESEESAKQQAEQEAAMGSKRSSSSQLGRPAIGIRQRQASGNMSTEDLYHSTGGAGYSTNFMHTIANADGTMSLIQVDPSNAQILTLPDGTQVRAVRLVQGGGGGGGDGGVEGSGQADSFGGQQMAQGELQEAIEIDASMLTGQPGGAGQAMALSEAQMGPDGQIIVTGEDGTQSCYPMSSLVSIPVSMYQQLAGSGQQISIVSADGSGMPSGAVSIHQLQGEPQDQLQRVSMHEHNSQNQQQVQQEQGQEVKLEQPQDNQSQTGLQTSH